MGSENSTVTMWDLATKRPVTSRKPLSGPIDSLAFSPDGKTLATGHDSGEVTLKLWNVTAQQVRGSCLARSALG